MTKYWIAIGVMAAILALLSSSLPIAAQDSAQDMPIGQTVEWPCESRYVGPMPEAMMAELPESESEWPCESRFVVIAAPQVELETAYSIALWPCESRYVGPMTDAMMAEFLESESEWPCESRFITMKAPQEELRPASSVVLWPCETRFVTTATGAEGMELAEMQFEWPCESRFAETMPVVVTLTTPFERHLTREEANKELYRLALNAFFETGDKGALLAYYPAELAETRAAEWSAMNDAFSDLTPTLDFQIAEGDRVFSCWTFQGVHTGEYMGIPPSGNEVKFMALYVGRVEEGRIVEELAQIDRYELLQEIGVAPVQGM